MTVEELREHIRKYPMGSFEKMTLKIILGEVTKDPKLKILKVVQERLDNNNRLLLRARDEKFRRELINENAILETLFENNG